MPIAEYKARHGFAIWLTGLPASGKSTIAKALAAQLAERGINAAVLESDVLRKIFTPQPCYTEEERQVFYASMAYVGQLMTEHGVSVIFDATANRRAYRDAAQTRIPRFIEVYVKTPLAVCISRDPKGIYKRASEGAATAVPGLQADYEAPAHPDLVIDGEQEKADAAAVKVMGQLLERGFL